MMVVEHGGDPIEPKSIKTVLLHPPAQVGQEKTQHLPAERHTHTHTHKVLLDIRLNFGGEKMCLEILNQGFIAHVFV